MEENIYIKYINTPIGWLELKANQKALLTISFRENKGNSSEDQSGILELCTSQLTEYFNGTRTEFSLNLAPKGTEFQYKVWNLVEDVQFGKTTSYLDIAIRSGSEKNTRAVGLANGKNPIPIIIPCHRIVGSNGKLTGYAGGLERKRWLLHHELTHSEKLGLLF